MVNRIRTTLLVVGTLVFVIGNFRQYLPLNDGISRAYHYEDAPWLMVAGAIAFLAGLAMTPWARRPK
jgi:hypothetical protein